MAEAKKGIGNEKLVKLQNIISKALMEEFKAQGHHMTGKIVDDIQYESHYRAKAVLEITGSIYPYGQYVQRGVKADKIPYSPDVRTGAGKSKYIQALISYAKQRMGARSEANAKSIAFAIARTQKKEGMPTKGSYRYTKTGKRLEWVIEAFKRQDSKITEAVAQIAFEATAAAFDLLITKYQHEFKKG